MKYKKLTKEQLEEYENKKLTSSGIIEMEQLGFKIPLIVKLYNLEKEDKMEFTKDTLNDMLDFAIKNEYYEKAALLKVYLDNELHPKSKQR
jgi:hypothetical protein|tara:strand:- start:1778 stop:2050 length:273 start_codon:yes stop_codon:yes gene_type:complete